MNMGLPLLVIQHKFNSTWSLPMAHQEQFPQKKLQSNTKSAVQQKQNCY